MSKLEELFERKLADHSIAPSPAAWENLEARLSKKNNRVILMRWAAVLLFGTLLSSLLWMKSRETELPLAKEAPHEQPGSKTSPKQTATPLVTEVKKESTTGRQKKKGIRHTNPSVLPTLAAIETGEVAEVPSEVTVDQKTDNPEEAKALPVTQSIVLTYTLDPVELPQTESAEVKVAASAERKDKSFKKMMKIANEVKNSDSPLGGIRNMKEDLFALDLKSKTTNKKH